MLSPTAWTIWYNVVFLELLLKGQKWIPNTYCDWGCKPRLGCILLYKSVASFTIQILKIQVGSSNSEYNLQYRKGPFLHCWFYTVWHIFQNIKKIVEPFKIPNHSSIVSLFHYCVWPFATVKTNCYLHNLSEKSCSPNLAPVTIICFWEWWRLTEKQGYLSERYIDLIVPNFTNFIMLITTYSL